MPGSMRPGDVLAGRYRLVDLLNESRGGWFWRAWDTVLARHVAVHLVHTDDSRAEDLMAAARRSATLLDPRLLRVLDAGTINSWVFVVNEWGDGVSLNNLLAVETLSPRRAAWLVLEVAEMVAAAHALDICHGRLVPENVMIDDTGTVKVVGFAVDAALHGVDEQRPAAEILDLAGLLYAALTGKWPGASRSGVPPAPQEHGRPLRPRQVRAGVPRVLDALCDEVLSPYPGPHDHGYDSATAIAEALEHYLGDRTAVAEAEAARNRGNTNPRIPRVEALVLAPDQPTPEPGPGDPAESEQGSDPASDPAAEEPSDPDGTGGDDGSGPETVAAAPDFDDDLPDELADDSWRAQRTDPVPPPPPFEEPPERPLFAPESASRPARTPRPAAEQPVERSDGFWPWDTDPGSGPPGGLDDLKDTGELEPVPGRSWMRTAWLLAIVLVLVIAMIYAFNRGREAAGPDASDEETSQAPPEPVRIASASDFDPLADPSEENPEDVPLAVDGDTATAWNTSTYEQDLGPGGLKEGVGLLVDLGRSTAIREVRLTFVGAPTGFELYTGDGSAAPTSLDPLTRIAGETANGPQVTIRPSDAEGRWLVLWLTSLPSVDDGYRGQVADIEVLS